MKAQYELVEIRPGEQGKAANFNSIKESTQETVLRLLRRENHEIATPIKNTPDPFWIYIHPHSTFMVAWCAFYLIVFYLVELQISLSIAFGPQFFQNQLEFGGAYRPVYLFFLCFMVLDIILSFFVGYYAFGKGKVVDETDKVVKNYLKNQFGFDLLAVLLYTIPLIYESFGLNFLQIVTASLFWIKKYNYQGHIDVYLQYYPGFRAFFMLFILFIDALMFGNFGACLFIWMDVFLYNESYYGTGTSSPYYWLTDNVDYGNSLIDGPWYSMYVYGQQFSTGTLSTLAPGPFARNPWEAVYAILLMILFMIYASYLADLLIQIVYTYSEPRILHEENILSFDNFMRMKEVGQHVRQRIYNYFELKWQLEYQTESTGQQAMINKLPINLKQTLLLEIGFTRYLYFLEKLPKESDLKKKISSKTQRTTADANTVIFSNHQPKRSQHEHPRSLFFIKEGMAKFYLSEQQLVSNGWKFQSYGGKILNLSNVERVVGVYEFITGQDFHYCCATLDLCLVQTLSWASFQEIIDQLKLKQSFEELKHRVLYQGELSLIHKTCIICLKQHLESECPQLYFYKSIQKQPFGRSNTGRKFARRPLNSKKIRGKQTKEEAMLGLAPQLNLGALLMDLMRINKVEVQQMQEACLFTNYCLKYNIVALQ